MSSTPQKGWVTFKWQLGTKIIWMWSSTVSWLMIGCINSLKFIVLLKRRKLLAGERIEKFYLLAGRWSYLWHHVISWMEGLERRKGETEVMEVREIWNELIRRSMVVSMTVGVFLLAIIVLIILIDCIFCHFYCWKKIEQHTE